MSRHRTRWLAAGIAILLAAALGFVALPAHAAGTGTVTGRFTDGATPIPDTFVTLYDLDFNQVRDTTTDVDGAFTLANVPVGSYKLGFTVPGVVTQFAFGKPENFEGADVITVTDGAVTTVEDTLAPHGEVAGRVTDAGGAPVPFPNVSATAPDFSYFAFTVGDENGNYRFQFLPAGSYVISFRRNDGGPTQYANGKRIFEEADHIPVVNGETTSLDQQLQPTATIRGRFTRQGEPVADATVRAFDFTTGDSESSRTDADGAYQLTVWPGTYVIQFDLSDFLSQYAHGQQREADADRFTVAAGQDLVVDEEAITTGTISGRLTGADGNPVANAGVGVANATTDLSGNTDEDGRYQIEVFPGVYRVSFHPGNGRQWAFGRSSGSTADPITVVGGETTVVDDALRPAGSITVRAKDANGGAALDQFCVFIPEVADMPCTTNGVVRMSLLPGRYEVQASVDSSDYLANRALVTVTSGQDTAVTIALSKQGKITTIVRDAATGAPLADACVEPVDPALPFTLGQRAFYCSDETGLVTIDQLSAGTYNLFAWAGDGVHGHQWVGPNGGTGAQAKGRLVTVRAGRTTTVPPVRLDRAGTIAGGVTDRSTGEAVNGWVGLASFSTGIGPGRAQPIRDGRYTWSDLGPYQWVLFFTGEGLSAQWSGGTPNRFLAAGVRVRVGATTTYNQRLSRGSTVSARVIRPGGAPFTFARITVFNALTNDIMGSGDCDPTTRCDTPVLGPQAVKLHYTVLANGEDLSGYHRDAADLQHATVVLVPSSGTRNVTVEATGLLP